MKGSNIILLVIVVTSVISIMSVGGGLFEQTNYAVSTGETESDVEETLQELNDFEFSLDNPISGLSQAFSMFISLLSLAWGFNSVLVLIGVPPWIANPIWSIARLMLLFAAIAILLRNGGIL